MNPLIELAQKIGDPIDDNKTESDSRPGSVDPQPGSYERFMSTFGNPARWAGR